MTYQQGWDAYAARRPLDDCATEAARRGWCAANAADAACLVVDYMVTTRQADRIDPFIESLRHWRNHREQQQ